MRTLKRGLASVAVVLAFACAGVACSGDDEGEDSGAGAFISEYCNLLMPCCAQAGLNANSINCQQMFGAFTVGYTYSEADGKSCLQAMRAAASQPDYCTTGASIEDNGACDGVFREPGSSSGTVQPGGTCDSDSDCAKSSKGEVTCFHSWSSSGSGSSETETCMVVMVGIDGSAPCVGTIEGNTTWYSGVGDEVPLEGYLCDKADGLFCSSSTNACTRMAAIGQDCGSSECTDDAYCDYGSGKCVALIQVGGECPSYNSCVDTAYCADSGTCTARLPDGTACETSESCMSDRCVNKVCEPSSDLGLTLICGD